MVLTNPRPESYQASTYYQSAQYISHSSVPSGLLDSIYLIIRRFTIKWKFSLLKPYLREGRLLDFGCGTGKFLEYCKSHQLEIYGVEPSKEAREIASSNNIPVVDSGEKLPDIKFNVITLWHVLEHIYDLHATLGILKNHLEDNGTIFIAVPNRECHDSTFYKENWAGYDVPRHLWHFTKTSMANLLEQADLKIKRIIPMKLDAYYVSLLSEKHKNNKLTLTGILRAFWVAFSSNRKAGNKMDYSSLIYIVQK